MSTHALDYNEPRFSYADIERMLNGSTRDKTYLLTRSGPYVQEYLAWYRLGGRAETTLDQCERDLALLVRHRPTLTIDQFAAGDLMLVLEQVPPGSWHRVRSHWNGLFKWAVQFGHRPSNPVELLPRVKQRSARIYDIFAITEQAKLVTSQDDSLLPKRDRLGVEIFQLGVRKNEARQLQPAHFDMTARVVYVQGKGGKERIVPFDENLWLALLEFMNTPVPQARQTDRRGQRFVEARLPRDDDYVFFPYGATRRGDEDRLLWTDPTRAMSSTAMHRWWVKAVDRAGVRYRSLHMNRHTTGTNLVDADVDSFSVRDWLGHADTRTTEIYVHNSRGRLQRASERLTALRKGDRS